MPEAATQPALFQYRLEFFKVRGGERVHDLPLARADFDRAIEATFFDALRSGQFAEYAPPFAEARVEPDFGTETGSPHAPKLPGGAAAAGRRRAAARVRVRILRPAALHASAPTWCGASGCRTTALCFISWPPTWKATRLRPVPDSASRWRRNRSRCRSDRVRLAGHGLRQAWDEPEAGRDAGADPAARYRRGGGGGRRGARAGGRRGAARPPAPRPRHRRDLSRGDVPGAGGGDDGDGGERHLHARPPGRGSARSSRCAARARSSSAGSTAIRSGLCKECPLTPPPECVAKVLFFSERRRVPDGAVVPAAVHGRPAVRPRAAAGSGAGPRAGAAVRLARRRDCATRI